MTIVDKVKNIFEPKVMYVTGIAYPADKGMLVPVLELTKKELADFKNLDGLVEDARRYICDSNRPMDDEGRNHRRILILHNKYLSQVEPRLMPDRDYTPGTIIPK